jgi:signal transduction histidine kinase/phage shock protein PspC (stress-responsive transcriptional regulator)
MATSASPPRPPARALRRDTELGVVGGVCAGIARELGVDPLVVRVAFVAAALAGGIGLAVYAFAWVLTPAAGEAVPARRTRTGRGALEVGLGTGLLLLSVLLAFRAAGIWFSDAVVWPLVLVASGGALIWRQSQDAPAQGATRAPVTREQPERTTADAATQRAAMVSRTGLGVALVVAAGVAFLQATGALSAARDALLAALVAVVVLAVIFAPWVMRLVRSLGAERAERIRSQERAEVAAHLHDSVLQTLALVQKRAEEPREVAALARRQERELRAWLSGRPAPGEGRLVAALEAVADDVERAHGVPVEIVGVGDRELDERAEAVVAAAREAIVNAAKFGGSSPVAVYAEITDGRVHVFVRDRGPGFEPAAVPPDRRGVRESIVGRMERHGGRAAIRSAPGQGTEVELVLERGA